MQLTCKEEFADLFLPHLPLPTLTLRLGMFYTILLREKHVLMQMHTHTHTHAPTPTYGFISVLKHIFV